MSLKGKTIVVTRDARQAKSFVNLLNEKKANVFLFPTIQLSDPSNIQIIQDTANTVSNYNWIIFTSAIAVRYFLKYTNPKDFKNVKIACVGKKTDAELNQYNLKADLIPKEFTSNRLLSDMQNIDLKNKKILIPCSSLSNDDLNNGFKKQGAIVNKLVVYVNSVFENPDKAKLKAKIEKKLIDCITFFSPSAVNSFVQLIGNESLEQVRLQNIPIAVIGSTTEITMKDYQLIPAIKPIISDNEHMVLALIEYFKN